MSKPNLSKLIKRQQGLLDDLRCTERGLEHLTKTMPYDIEGHARLRLHYDELKLAYKEIIGTDYRA